MDHDTILTRADLTAEQLAEQARGYRFFLTDPNWPGEILGFRTRREAEKMVEYRNTPRTHTTPDDLTAEQRAAVMTRSDMTAGLLAEQSPEAHYFLPDRNHAGEILGFRTRRDAEWMMACWIDSPTTRLPANFFETLSRGGATLW